MEQLMSETAPILWLIVCGMLTFYCGLRRIGIWLKSNASEFDFIKHKSKAVLKQEELLFLRQYKVAYIMQFIYAIGGIIVFPAIAVFIVL